MSAPSLDTRSYTHTVGCLVSMLGGSWPVWLLKYHPPLFSSSNSFMSKYCRSFLQTHIFILKIVFHVQKNPKRTEGYFEPYPQVSVLEYAQSTVCSVSFRKFEHKYNQNNPCFLPVLLAWCFMCKSLIPGEINFGRHSILVSLITKLSCQ